MKRIKSKKNEVWKYIWETNGFYQVSNFGRVRSYKNNGHKRNPVPHELPWHEHTHGYCAVCLWIDKHPINKYVHRLVLETFVGECPNGMECIHLDNNKKNNKLSNLKWGTHKENQTKYDTSPIIGALGENNPNAKLTENAVINIRKEYQYNKNCSAIARKYNVGRKAIVKVVQKKTWKHVK